MRREGRLTKDDDHIASDCYRVRHVGIADPLGLGQTYRGVASEGGSRPSPPLEPYVTVPRHTA